MSIVLNLALKQLRQLFEKLNIPQLKNTFSLIQEKLRIIEYMSKVTSIILITLIVLTITFIVINLDKGMSLVLVSRYLGNFSSEKILTQIYAANAMVKNLLRAIIGFLGSYLLDITNTANSMVIVGLFLLVVSISLIGYMKTRLGLKPEEYGEDEIYNKDEVYKEKTKV